MDLSRSKVQSSIFLRIYKKEIANRFCKFSFYGSVGLFVLTLLITLLHPQLTFSVARSLIVSALFGPLFFGICQKIHLFQLKNPSSLLSILWIFAVSSCLNACVNACGHRFWASIPILLCSKDGALNWRFNVEWYVSFFQCISIAIGQFLWTRMNAGCFRLLMLQDQPKTRKIHALKTLFKALKRSFVFTLLFCCLWILLGEGFRSLLLGVFSSLFIVEGKSFGIQLARLFQVLPSALISIFSFVLLWDAGKSLVENVVMQPELSLGTSNVKYPIAFVQEGEDPMAKLFALLEIRLFLHCIVKECNASPAANVTGKYRTELMHIFEVLHSFIRMTNESLVHYQENSVQKTTSKAEVSQTSLLPECLRLPLEKEPVEGQLQFIAMPENDIFQSLRMIIELSDLLVLMMQISLLSFTVFKAEKEEEFENQPLKHLIELYTKTAVLIEKVECTPALFSTFKSKFHLQYSEQFRKLLYQCLSMGTAESNVNKC